MTNRYLCGETVVRLRGEAQPQFYCHCDDCQATSGGAYTALAVYAASDAEVVKDNLVSWTLRTMPRHRCKTCGTHMTATVEPGKLTGVRQICCRRDTSIPPITRMANIRYCLLSTSCRITRGFRLKTVAATSA